MESNRKQKVVVAHSPDADDAFMFYALATGKVNSPLVEFEHVLKDIESLNQAAHEGIYEMTAISYHAYPYVADRYMLTAAGSSVGDGYGPLIVSKHEIAREDLKGCTIAVPGKETTAYLATRLFQPDFKAKMVHFDSIVDSILHEDVDAGVLIHEGQLSYAGSGLRKVVDLGEWWKNEQGLPLPLGANAVLRSLTPEVRQECGLRLKQTIQYALNHREDAVSYALQFGRGLDEQTADRFIGMYVNHHTTDMRADVLEGAQKLLDMGYAAGLIDRQVKIDYV